MKRFVFLILSCGLFCFASERSSFNDAVKLKRVKDVNPYVMPDYTKFNLLKKKNTYYTPQLKVENTETTKIKERHWQLAINKKLFHGQLEKVVENGRIDIVTDTHVIEVDKISKYKEGIDQCVRYAKATSKTPLLALYIDGNPNSLELWNNAVAECEAKKIEMLLINNYVAIQDLLSLSDKDISNPKAVKRP